MHFLKYLYRDCFYKLYMYKKYINMHEYFYNDQFSSVAESCLTLCDPMDSSTPGFPAHHQFPELPQTHAHRVIDAIQPQYQPHLSDSALSKTMQEISEDSRIHFYDFNSSMNIKNTQPMNNTFQSMAILHFIRRMDKLRRKLTSLKYISVNS